jgi:hypothetical protein
MLLLRNTEIHPRRAFHGELSADDPTEESALELLKSVL